MSATAETELTFRIEAATGGRHRVTVSNGPAAVHVDVLDLGSSTSRSRFVKALVKEVEGLDADRVHAELLRLADAPLPAPECAAKADDDPRGESLAAMPADVRVEAAEFLDDPKLLERVVADIAAAGVVGEARLAATLYLAGVSAQLPKPLSVIVRGSSSSGKSYVLACIASLFPPEVALHATSLTTNALYYFPPGTLRHRFVVAGERSRVEDDDTAEATRALREMIEAGRLTKAVPVKEDDQIVTRVLTQEGPIAFAETTTLGTIFEEDANRCLLLATDEREEQTRRVLAATAARVSGRGDADRGRLTAVHHAVQRMLPRCDVVVPFAEHVAALYPADRIEARRAFRHLLVLVKASALLHFRQRQRDANGRVVAMVADYAIAEKLARGPLGSAASGISDGARQYLAILKGKFATNEFTTTDALSVGGGTSRRTKYNRLTELNHAGALEQTESARGKVPAKWKLTGVDPGGGDGILPSVQSVLDRLSGCTRAHKP